MIKQEPNTIAGSLEEKMNEDNYREILIRPDNKNFGYQSIVEFKGYYTTTERSTTLNPEPTKTCAAFKVTEGPDDALNYMGDRSERTEENLIVLGELDAIVESPWWDTPDIKSSTSSNQIVALFRIGTRFESEAVGCLDPQVKFIGTVPSN